jgi:hypothetical protein
MKEYLGSVQGKLGVYDPQSDVVTLSDLQKVGLELSIRATGHGDIYPGAFAMDEAMLPTAVQFQFTRVDTPHLFAKAIMNKEKMFGSDGKFEIPDTELDENAAEGSSRYGADETVSISNRNAWSYGHLNSPLEPFDGPAPMGMLLISALAIIAILIVFIIINEIIKKGDDGQTNAQREGFDGPHNHPYGQYGSYWANKKGTFRVYDNATVWMNWFRIPFTRARWDSCFARGVQAFYGFTEGISDIGTGSFMMASPGEIIEMMRSLLAAPGYYTSIMRHVIRDTDQIAQSINLFTAGGGFSITGLIAGIFGLIEAIVNSTTWGFIMAMTSVGDAIISDKFNVFSPIPLVGPRFRGKDQLDALPDTAAYRISKSRAKQDESRLVWEARSAPSLYLLPVEQETAIETFPVGGARMIGGKRLQTMSQFFEPNVTAEHDDAVRNSQQSPNGNKSLSMTDRAGGITPDLVREHENWLEAEYVPFYFHDMRTNEILAFHAFLSNISETFSPSWNSNSSMGRIDDIQIYNRTSRTLSLEFKVAALSHDDFNEMWYKLNRLTAMVYPQFSAGKSMETHDGRRFRMPFSQIPTASPVIRLRIGDLIKSNYSRFGLAKLFGIGEGAFKASFAGADAGAQKAGQAAAETEHSGKLQARSAVIVKTITDTAKGGNFPDGLHVKFKIGWKGIPRQQPDDGPPEPAVANTDVSPGRGGKIHSQVPIGGTTQSPSAPQAEEGSTPPATSPAKPATGASAPEAPVAETTKYEYIVEMNDPAQPSSVEPASGDSSDGGSPPGSKVWFAVKVPGDSLTIDQTMLAEFAGAEARAELGTAGKVELGDSVKNFFAGAENTTTSNAVVRSFEATMGRGLAGVITGLDFAYNESTWAIDIGDRAPIFTTVTMGFTVIHDITPGLDAKGFMRAPTHPVGEVVRNIFGTVHGGAAQKWDGTKLAGAYIARRKSLDPAAGGEG